MVEATTIVIVKSDYENKSGVDQINAIFQGLGALTRATEFCIKVSTMTDLYLEMVGRNDQEYWSMGKRGGIIHKNDGIKDNSN